MAVNNNEAVPLYVHTIYRILREMRVAQQLVGSRFNYREFKRQMMDSGLSPAQLGPLHQRLDALESFMPKGQVYSGKKGKGKVVTSGLDEGDWTSKVCSLTKLDTLANSFSLGGSQLSTSHAPVSHRRVPVRFSIYA